MNKEITNRIKEYLTLETDYAIILSGDYGIGKTYYLRNELPPAIKNIEIPNSKGKEKFTPVLISLFGTKSIDAVQDKILFELYPILKRKGIKLLAGLGNRTLKYFTDSKLREVFDDIGLVSDNLINYNNILLCIDDIDRISDDLNLKEIFGFINDLVENLNAKVLIVANEDKLKTKVDKDKTDIYFSLKEKVVGISMQFQTNVSLVFEEIIKNKYEKNNKDYFDFLFFNKEYIVKKIIDNKNNLRVLLFFLEHLKVVFENLISFFAMEKKFELLKKDIELSILKFTLPISIEYKLGNLNPSNFPDIQSTYYNSFSSLKKARLLPPSEQEKSKEEKTYSDYFERKYGIDSIKEKHYFESILNYITGQRALNIEQLKDEIKTIFKIDNNKAPEVEQILKKLNHRSCTDLTAKEYASLTKKLLYYVDIGAYDLNQYITIFHFVTRFNNPLRYNLSKLIKRFERGILKGKNHYKYQPHWFPHLHIEKTNEFCDELKKIIDICVDINNILEEEEYLNEIKDAEALFQNDINLFISIVNSNYSFIPIFSRFNFKKFWNILIKTLNSQIIDLALCFEYRYRMNIPSGLLPEKEFLIALHKKLEVQLNSKSVKHMKKFAFNVLLEKVQISINNFQNE